MTTRVVRLEHDAGNALCRVEGGQVAGRSPQHRQHRLRCVGGGGTVTVAWLAEHLAAS